MMEFLPKEIEDIINDYKFKLEYFDNLKEHKKIFSKCINIISNMRYNLEYYGNHYYSTRMTEYYRLVQYTERISYSYKDCIIILFNDYNVSAEVFNIDSDIRNKKNG